MILLARIWRALKAVPGWVWFVGGLLGGVVRFVVLDARARARRESVRAEAAAARADAAEKVVVVEQVRAAEVHKADADLAAVKVEVARQEAKVDAAAAQGGQALADAGNAAFGGDK